MRFKYYVKLLKNIWRWKTAELYVISFPRSGRTWLRCLLQDLRIAASHRGWQGGVVRKARKGTYTLPPNIIEENVKELRGKKVLFVVREPADVALSFFRLLHNDMHHKKGDVPTDISDFIRDEQYGVPAVVSFNELWMQMMEKYHLTYSIVVYEDLYRDTETTLKNLGLPTNRVDECNIHKMRSNNPKKVKTGGTSKYKDILSPEDRTWYENYMKKAVGESKFLSKTLPGT